MSTTYSLISELERLASALSAGDGARDAANSSGSVGETSAQEVPIASVAERIAKSLGVKSDEVAILRLSTRWKHLYFMAPAALKNVGYIPLSSNSALAARTARENRAEIVNNFAAVRHASVFEGVKIGSESGEAIQKIISAPILADERVIGIIQVSRKGLTAMSAGPDFTADELGKVLALCKPLGKLISHMAPDPEN
jgi:GAF domain